MELHEKIQELRKKKALTQEELAQALYVSRTAVSKWESNRGYPSIDSLKALAVFFDVTVDELLSGEELLSLAEEEGRERKAHLCGMVFALIDCGAALLFFLPFFGQRVGGGVAVTSLLFFDGVSPWVKTAYLLIAAGITLWGILSLALQNCAQPLWMRGRYKISQGLTAVGALLFIASLQPYAAVFLLTLLAIKALLLVKGK